MGMVQQTKECIYMTNTKPLLQTYFRASRAAWTASSSAEDFSLVSGVVVEILFVSISSLLVDIADTRGSDSRFERFRFRCSIWIEFAADIKDCCCITATRWIILAFGITNIIACLGANIKVWNENSMRSNVMGGCIFWYRSCMRLDGSCLINDIELENQCWI